jgi:hypothetical protein
LRRLADFSDGRCWIVFFAIWALKPRLLIFDRQFPALWTCAQDDELVMDNQGLWFRRSCEELLQ